jgi:hypothetical protein
VKKTFSQGEAVEVRRLPGDQHWEAATYVRAEKPSGAMTAKAHSLHVIRFPDGKETTMSAGRVRSRNLAAERAKALGAPTDPQLVARRLIGEALTELESSICTTVGVFLVLDGMSPTGVDKYIDKIRKLIGNARQGAYAKVGE